MHYNLNILNNFKIKVQQFLKVSRKNTKLQIYRKLMINQFNNQLNWTTQLNSDWSWSIQSTLTEFYQKVLHAHLQELLFGFNSNYGPYIVASMQ